MLAEEVSGITIGAGSVVTKDIPAGVPCKVVREITDDDIFEDMNEDKDYIMWGTSA